MYSTLNIPLFTKTNAHFLNIENLLTHCKKGDRKAQQSLYNLYKDRFFALSMKYCKNRDEAHDNLQESFITILTKITTFNNKGSFEGWMKRIVINKAIDRYKREPYLESIDDYQVEEEDTKIDESELSISLQELLLLVQELPDRYRLVFNMYQLDNYTHQEIAQTLEISLGTSKSNLHRAKTILKEKIITYMASQKNSIVNGN